MIIKVIVIEFIEENMSKKKTIVSKKAKLKKLDGQTKIVNY